MKQLIKKLTTQSMVSSSLLMIFAHFTFNAANYIFIIFMGRLLNVTEFGILTLLSSFFFILQIPSRALTGTTQRNVAYYKKDNELHQIFSYSKKVMITLTGLSLILYLLLIPGLKTFFHFDTYQPLIYFMPVLIGLFALSWYRALLAGLRHFSTLTITLLIEGTVKVFVGVGLMQAGFGLLGAILAFPISIIIATIPAWYFITKQYPNKHNKPKKITKVMSKELNRYFSFSVVSSTGLMLLSSIDIILLKHFLTPELAGQYSLLTIFGKIILLGATAFSAAISPYIAASLDNKKRFYRLVTYGYSIIASYVGILALLFALFPSFFALLLVGDKASLISGFLPRYAIGVALLSLANFTVGLQMLQKRFSFAFVPVIFSISLSILLWLNHQNLFSIIVLYQRSAAALFGAVSLLYLYMDGSWHWQDFKDLFGKEESISHSNSKKHILIYNWRDMKHVWAGGAELYVHELAKQWVAKGHRVTVFCGNDRNNSRYETIDGVSIIRRGGFVTVYIWAILYYWFKLRKKVDVIIDCENGIPFFTPLYTNKPITLVIHHVHTEVFRNNLPLPLAQFAIFLESLCMPFVYRKAKVVTVSESSQAEIKERNWFKQPIHVVHNGVDTEVFIPGKKSKTPLVAYIGRLKAYKSIHIFINAAALILKEKPQTKFVIAGFGEEQAVLENLAKDLGIDKKITFTGKIGEKEKIRLFQKAWVTVNPSFMEGFGLTAIESSACATPVIASRVSGLKDSVKHNKSGFLTEYGNSQAFANNILKLIENQKIREEMSSYARRFSLKFDWGKSAMKFLKLMNKESNQVETFPFSTFIKNSLQKRLVFIKEVI